MVKANAYGLGSYEISEFLQHHHIDYLGVAFADEGVELRKKGITTPIIVMNPEQEKAFLKTGELEMNEDHRIIKAFSEDEEISQFFSVNDFSNTEANVDFQSVVESLYERSDDNKDFIEVNDMRNNILAYIEIHPEYRYSFNAREIGGVINMTKADWRPFTAFMFSNGYCRRKVRIGKKTQYAWVGLKLIPDALHQTVVLG